MKPSALAGSTGSNHSAISTNRMQSNTVGLPLRILYGLAAVVVLSASGCAPCAGCIPLFRADRATGVTDGGLSDLVPLEKGLSKAMYEGNTVVANLGGVQTEFRTSGFRSRPRLLVGEGSNGPAVGEPQEAPPQEADFEIVRLSDNAIQIVARRGAEADTETVAIVRSSSTMRTSSWSGEPLRHVVVLQHAGELTVESSTLESGSTSISSGRSSDPDAYTILGFGSTGDGGDGPISQDYGLQWIVSLGPFHHGSDGAAIVERLDHDTAICVASFRGTVRQPLCDGTIAKVKSGRPGGLLAAEIDLQTGCVRQVVKLGEGYFWPRAVFSSRDARHVAVQAMVSSRELEFRNAAGNPVKRMMHPNTECLLFFRWPQ